MLGHVQHGSRLQALLWQAPDARVFHDLQDAIDYYRVRPEFSDLTIFVIGGAQVYSLSIPLLDEIWLTEIDQEFEGDTRFPGYRGGRLELSEFDRAESRPQSEPHPQNIQYRFCVYRRVSG